MKKITSNIACFISGVIIASTVGAMAASYTATENTFPIKVNGQNVQMEGYNIEGSTYFKLRDIGDKMGFDVGFENGIIYVGEVPVTNTAQNETGPIEISVANSGEKTKGGFSIYKDGNSIEYFLLTDVNSMMLDIKQNKFDMWIVSWTDDKTYWRMEYINVTDDYMWNNDLVYALNGGRLYVSNGKYYIKCDDFQTIIPEIGTKNGKPNEKYEIVKDSKEHNK
ncbi:hypothetical protein FMM68_09895 [Lachnospiraceae bacterium MD329]|nr:hypothetical protein [Lachnospiraceae bacterium MD329]